MDGEDVDRADQLHELRVARQRRHFRHRFQRVVPETGRAAVAQPAQAGEAEREGKAVLLARLGDVLDQGIAGGICGAVSEMMKPLRAEGRNIPNSMAILHIRPAGRGTNPQAALDIGPLDVPYGFNIYPLVLPQDIFRFRPGRGP
ncbi:hypothetical protein GGR43_004018 [Sphingobium jiangsuense]|uniref:Uncharacterized protein n=1 Tax=Sphingobium jiangsuense TaxID=870476 RepID=A0A7W6FSP2_9SPHN|nr:hypothetical protein [Sphingobium jiangsuense]MBB3928274.1 hypothetical protein [Sphingobium jiangsuense]